MLKTLKKLKTATFRSVTWRIGDVGTYRDCEGGSQVTGKIVILVEAKDHLVATIETADGNHVVRLA